MYFISQTSKNSLSELEKREKRAMERKLSEMEEELKVRLKFDSTHKNLYFVGGYQRLFF